MQDNIKMCGMICRSEKRQSKEKVIGGINFSNFCENCKWYVDYVLV